MDRLMNKMIFSLGFLKYLESFENLMMMSCDDKFPHIEEIPMPLIKKDGDWYTKFKSNNKLDTQIANTLVKEELYAAFDEQGNIGIPVLEDITLMPVNIGKMFVRSSLMCDKSETILDFFRVIGVCSKRLEPCLIVLIIEHEMLEDDFIKQAKQYFANKHNKH